MRMKSHKQIKEQSSRILRLAGELYYGGEQHERYIKYAWHIALDAGIDWCNNIYHYVEMFYPSAITPSAKSCEPSHFDENMQFPDWVYKTNWFKADNDRWMRRCVH